MWNNYRKRAAPFFIDRREYSLEREIIYPFAREGGREVLSDLRLRGRSGNSFRSIGDATLPEVISSSPASYVVNENWQGINDEATLRASVRADGEIPPWCSGLSQVNDKRFARCRREIPSRQFPKVSRNTELFKARRDYASRREIIPAVSPSPSEREIAQKLIVAHPKFRFAFPRRRDGKDLPEVPPGTRPVPGSRTGCFRTLRTSGPWLGLTRNSRVTLKVMTRKYYRRGMSRRERPPRTCVTYEKLPARACDGARRSPKCTHLFTPVRRHNVSYIMLFLSRQCGNKRETCKRPDCWFRRRSPLKLQTGFPWKPLYLWSVWRECACKHA